LKYLVSAFLMALLFSGARAQVVINEASNRNYTQVYDDNDETHDWFELYNPGPADISLLGWGISDNKDIIRKWIFPDYVLTAGSYLVVFASGLDIRDAALIDHWESAILPSDMFYYLEPDASTPPNWFTPAFDAGAWPQGTGGFGYGDGDDNTQTNPSSVAVYIRRYFNLPDTSALVSAVLHVDYDDGFVAYLNGIEIARRNVDGTPTWNSYASGDHEALMLQGTDPELVGLDMSLIKDIWTEGNNLFAMEVHNITSTSSDLSMLPFLSFGVRTGNSYFQSVPYWFPIQTGNFLHTNFKLDAGGETLYLSAPGGALVDSLPVPRIPLDASIGRVTDGAIPTGIFTVSTPGESNNTSQAYTGGFEPVPEFSTLAGFYSSAVSVGLTTTSPTAEIRFTIDGSEPTPSSSLYSGTPVTISTTETLKAKCFSTADKLPSPPVASTYFISESHVLPVISISTDNTNLYGPTGIFDNIDAVWNKPCYIEYFDESKTPVFKQEAGIQIDGGAGGSRSQPQHSVRIEPGNGTLGDGNVNYALIPDRRNRKNYSSFYLRNGSNQYNWLQYKDGLQVKAIAKNTHTYYSAYSAIVAYINGAYFGLYELREKLNADFLAENYQMNNDSLDLLTLSYYKGSVLEALEGSVDPFWADYNHFMTLSPSATDYLDQVGQFLDLDNYTDYIIAQSWIANTDWPYNNIRVFRNSTTDFRWQFAVQDVEWSMLPNGWTTASDDHIGYMLGQGDSYPYISYWQHLMQNSEYRTYFINRFADLMNTNYRFSVTGAMEEEIYSYQYPEMAAEFARWGNSSMSAYRANHTTLRSQLEIRSGYVREHMQNHFSLTGQVDVTLNVQPEGAGQIKISTIVPVNYPWQGIYFTDNPVKITALANPGYKFSSWSDNDLISDLADPEFIADLAGSSASFTANFEESIENFQGVTISEIHYKNGSNENSTDWIELYNGSASPVSLSGWYFTDSDTAHRYLFGSSSQIGANARLVVAYNLDDFTSMYPEVSNYTGPFDFKLGTPVDAVNLYDNTDLLVAGVNYSDLYPWPLNGDETGRTLELRDPAGDLNDPSNWFAGCIGGSPGSSFIPCPEPVDIEPPMLTLNTMMAYPNPATDYVSIDFSLQEAYTNCVLKVYTILGAEVKATDLGDLSAGTSAFTIDLSAVPTGMLIIVFQADGVQERVKLLHLE
jgi:hypothetical protein